MADSVRRRLRQTTHSTRGAVLTGARWLARQEASGELAHLDGWVLHLLRVPGDPHTSIGPSGGGLLTTGMKELFGRERPDLVPHLVAVTSPSFPSGHSLLAAVLYLTLGALLARFAARRHTKVYLLTVALVATFPIGSSRVYLGVHYPSDG